MSFTATVAEIAQGATKRCPNGHAVKLVDDDGGAQEVQSSLDDLDAAIERLGE